MNMTGGIMKKNFFLFWLFFCFFLLLYSQIGFALTIQNKAKFKAYLIIKNERFHEIVRLEIAPQSEELYDLAEKAKSKHYQIEAYILNPHETIHSPTFLHEVKNKDKICVPLNLCPPERKKR